MRADEGEGRTKVERGERGLAFLSKIVWRSSSGRTVSARSFDCGSKDVMAINMSWLAFAQDDGVFFVGREIGCVGGGCIETRK